MNGLLIRTTMELDQVHRMSDEAVSLILPIRNVAEKLPELLKAWHGFFQDIHRSFEIILVDLGSSDDTLSVARSQAEELPHVVMPAEPVAAGFGGALRVGIAIAKHPLIAYAGCDYPYTPTDLAKLLDRIADMDQQLGRPIDLVSGCRNGLPSPLFWSQVGQVYRLFCRVILGLPLNPPMGWLGVREHWRSWLVWGMFGDPLTDPNSAFKVIRRTVLDRFPIQSDGDFVHVEIVSKATFTTCLMDELELTPQQVPIPYVVWTDFWRVFNDPKFNAPSRMDDIAVSVESAPAS